MNGQHHALTIGSKSQSHFNVMTFKALKMDRCDCCQEGFEKIRQYAWQNLVQFCLSLSSSAEGCAANTTEGRDASQRDLDKLDIWVHKNVMKLNKSNQGAANELGQSQISRLGELMESSPAERGCEEGRAGCTLHLKSPMCWADPPAEGWGRSWWWGSCPGHLK